MESTEQHLFEGPEYQLVQASGGKRFVNYLIDTIVFLVLMFMFGMLLGMLNPASVDPMTADDPGLGLIDILSILLYVAYFSLLEIIFKGTSLGKLITGTRAVREDGSYITPKEAFLRALSRLVPFEPFSALGSPSYPWHDKWSRTYVIDERQSNHPAA